jgi:hypothetical protein
LGNLAKTSTSYKPPFLPGAWHVSRPENLKVVAFTPLGYPADDSGMRTRLTKFFVGSAKRKPLEEIVHKEKW